MKKSKKLLISALGTLIASFCLLAVTVLCIFAHIPEGRPVSNGELSPSIINVGGVPISWQKLSEKYDAYTHISYENGKRTATIFSVEQINDIEERRENGEWLCLTTEEALYLISDTISLFESYDVIKINTIDGRTKTYGTNSESDERSTDIYDVMLFRLEALHSGISRAPISGLTNEMVLFIGLKEKKSQLLIDFEANNFYSFYYEKLEFNYSPICGDGVLMFYKGKVYFVNDISQRVRNDMLCIIEG